MSHNYDHGVARQALGPTPHPEIVEKVLREAGKCERDRHSEFSWNCRVHNLVLSTALGNSMYDDKIDHICW